MLLFILLAMMLAGCSGDAPEVIAEPSTPKPVVSPDDGEIRFKVGTEWQGKGDTRAALFADADALVTEGSFKVYAYVGATTNAHIDGSTAVRQPVILKVNGCLQTVSTTGLNQSRSTS